MSDDKLEIDWEASKVAWIDEVRRLLIQRLWADKRFPDEIDAAL